MKLESQTNDSASPTYVTARHSSRDRDRWPIETPGESPCIKRLGRWLSILGMLALSLGAAQAQNFSIDWHVIDGGGGTSAGGNFSLSGTMGQPEANALPMTGGGFSLIGGFWSLFAVQEPHAPVLAIACLTVNSVRVAWPSPSTDFVLQQSADLTTTNWVNAPQAVSDNGTNKYITVDSAARQRQFYRLIKP